MCWCRVQDNGNKKDVDMVTNMYAKAENCVFDLVVVAIAFVISDNNN